MVMSDRTGSKQAWPCWFDPMHRYRSWRTVIGRYVWDNTAQKPQKHRATGLSVQYFISDALSDRGLVFSSPCVTLTVHC